MATLTLQPSSTGDGYMYRAVAEYTQAGWDGARASTSGLVANSTATFLAVWGMFESGGGEGSDAVVIGRSGLVFDTSSLGSATVTGVTLYVTQSITTVNHTGYGMVVCPTTLTSIDPASYAIAKWGATSLGVFGGTRTAETEYSASVVGLSINGSGNTWVGLRSYCDFNNIFPSYEVSLYNYVHSSESATPSCRPKLTVEYTEGFTPITLPSFRKRVA
jgi:hypothetical protein